jgi:hypothetical protein
MIEAPDMIFGKDREYHAHNLSNLPPSSSSSNDFEIGSSQNLRGIGYHHFQEQAPRNVAEPVCHVNGRDVSSSDRPQK